jgi:hypothetical protein
MAHAARQGTFWRGGWVRFREPVGDFARCEPVTVRAHDGTQVRGLYWTPRRGPGAARAAVVAAHPRVDFSQHYAFPALLRAGYACLGANLRSLHNDVNCVHEQLLLDLAAYVGWLRERRGIERLAWLGNSGGGSLGCMYQWQAVTPPAQRLADTPAGRPVPLREIAMPAFDAMLVTAAHTGQGLVLAGTIDPSVVDEHEPLLTDPTLDMYDPANGFQPAPRWTRYEPAFIARYRAAQLARVARIDAVARSMLDGQRSADDATRHAGFAALPHAAQRTMLRRAAFQPVMTVYRTLANPNYVDDSLDPSRRGYGSLVSPRPDLANFQLHGFARLQTPDAWLSTWSAASSRANVIETAPAVTVPTVVVNAGRDLDVYPQTHSRAFFEALGAADKTYVEFPDRLHYFEPEDGEDENAGALEQMAVLVPWLQARIAP